MKKTILDVKKGEKLNRKTKRKEETLGVISNGYFLDLKDFHYYPILPIKMTKKEVVVTNLETYIPSSKEEKEYILSRLNYYMESNIISFEEAKQKIKQRKCF